MENKEKEKIEYHDFGDGTRGIVVPNDVFEFEQKLPTVPSFKFGLGSLLFKSFTDLQKEKENKYHPNLIEELTKRWKEMGIPITEYKINENGEIERVEDDVNKK